MKRETKCYREEYSADRIQIYVQQFFFCSDISCKSIVLLCCKAFKVGCSKKKKLNALWIGFRNF